MGPKQELINRTTLAHQPPLRSRPPALVSAAQVEARKQTKLDDICRTLARTDNRALESTVVQGASTRLPSYVLPRKLTEGRNRGLAHVRPALDAARARARARPSEKLACLGIRRACLGAHLSDMITQQLLLRPEPVLFRVSRARSKVLVRVQATHVDHVRVADHLLVLVVGVFFVLV